MAKHYCFPPYLSLPSCLSVCLPVIFQQISARKNCRTVCTTPAIYTSKRAARPGMGCYYFSCRFALLWRRNSQKTTLKNPIDFAWGKTENIVNFAATFLWHTLAQRRKWNFRADTRLWTFVSFKPFSNTYYGLAIVAAQSQCVLGCFWRETTS